METIEVNVLHRLGAKTTVSVAPRHKAILQPMAFLTKKKKKVKSC